MASWSSSTFAPAAIPQAGRLSGGVDQIGEQHRGQQPVRFGAAAAPGHELADLVQPGVLVPGEGEVVVAFEFDQAGAGDVARQVAGGLDGDDPVAPPVQHQRRDPHRRQDGTHIDLPNHRGQAQVARPGWRTGARSEPTSVRKSLSPASDGAMRSRVTVSEVPQFAR